MRKLKGKLTSKLEDHFAAEFLDPLKVKYERQKRIGFFSFDFFLPDFNLLIEINGTYYHADPRVYKSNDLNGMQRNNLVRDKQKAKAASNFGFRLLSLAEGDIYFNPESVQAELDQWID